MSRIIKLQGVNNITVSGRIATGASTLAHHIATKLNWGFFNGGQIFRKYMKEQGIDIHNSKARSDKFDLDYEAKLKKMLLSSRHKIFQSHLAGFDAQNVKGIYKILVICDDEEGNDKTDIRIDRMVNRDGKTIEQAKYEITEREQQNLEKWRKLYANNDPDWIYWDKKYYGGTTHRGTEKNADKFAREYIATYYTLFGF